MRIASVGVFPTVSLMEKLHGKTAEFVTMDDVTHFPLEGQIGSFQGICIPDPEPEQPRRLPINRHERRKLKKVGRLN